MAATHLEKFAVDRRFRSISGVERYDRLATELPEELAAFLKRVEDNGWIVKSTTKLDPVSPAQFFPRKRRFYCDPRRMTYLDMLHEEKHLSCFIERGNWKLGKGQTLLYQDEIAAYSHELELLRRESGATTAYVEYLEGQIANYRRILSQDGPSRLRPSSMPDPFMKRSHP